MPVCFQATHSSEFYMATGAHFYWLQSHCFQTLNTKILERFFYIKQWFCCLAKCLYYFIPEQRKSSYHETCMMCSMYDNAWGVGRRICFVMLCGLVLSPSPFTPPHPILKFTLKCQQCQLQTRIEYNEKTVMKD